MTDLVAPLVGAWIEILHFLSFYLFMVSLLSWERGLKLYLHCTDLIPELSLLSWERGLKYRIPNFNSNKKFVAPLVGAWIEIHMEVDGTCLPIVAPLVGAWIEITKRCRNTNSHTPSLLSWERGLKSFGKSKC